MGIRKRAVITECVLLLLAALVSALVTADAVAYAEKFIPYFAVALLGAALAVLLFVLRNNRFALFLGIAFLFVYLVTAGFGGLACQVNKTRLRRLESYKQHSVQLILRGRQYDWDRESITYTPTDMELLPLQDAQQAELRYDGEKRDAAYSLYLRRGEDVVYYEISSSGTGEYLVLTPRP